MIDVRQWLDSLDLEQYADAFEENAIEWEQLPKLNRSILKDIGVGAAGHRMKLLDAAAGIDVSPSLEALGDLEPTSLSPPLRPTDEAERRQLTVLFADLVGSTELSHQLDPEDLREINRAYQDAAKAAIERYGGFVARYMGDGVLAYFGYPHAHEDDAERAVRAGLELTESVPSIPTGPTLAVRVGISTGPVVVGDLIGEGASQERAVVGETPNLAARLQAVASPNSTLIGASTEHLVAGRFEMVPLGSQQLKGIAVQIPVFRVLRLKETESRFDAASSGRLSPLIGRDDELTLIQRRWQRATSTEFQLVMISGEPGIGKSRLTRAVRDAARRDEATMLLYQCSPFYTSSSFQPFIEQMRRAARIAPGEPPEKQLDRLEVLLRRSATFFTDDVPLFGSLLGIPCDLPPSLQSSEERRNRTNQGLVRQLRGLAAERTVLCVFEDIHWADPSTLDVLSNVIDQLGDLPILLLVTYRPEFRSPWVSQAQSTSVVLNRMSPRETASLIEAIGGLASQSPQLVSTIVERTDGVPLFVEELTQTIAELGETGELDQEEALAGVAIPSSLQDALMERLDRLGEAKQVAQAASVMGREFTRSQLEAVSQLSTTVVTGALHHLQRAELVFSRRTDDEVHYVFKHALVQDAAYQTLLQSQRQLLHERAAELLAEESAPREVIARHYEKAGRLADAVASWHMAGRRAASVGALREALEHLTNALRHVPGLGPGRKGQEIECDLQIDLTRNLVILDRFDEAFEALERAELLARELDDPLRLSLTCHYRGNVWFPLGQFENCLSEQERARREARRGRSVELEARALGGLCDANYQRGWMKTAHAFAEECIALAATKELHGVVAGYLGMRACTRAYLNRISDAISDAFDSVELARQFNRHRSAVVSYQIAGYFLLESGDRAGAQDALQRGLDLAREIGVGRFEPISLLFLSRIHWSEGRAEEARQTAEEAKRISDETAPMFTGPWPLGTLLRLARTDETREEICAAATEVLCGGCVSHNHFWFHRDAMDAWICGGNLPAAIDHASMLEAYTAREPLPWTNFYVRRGRALARFLDGKDEAREEIESLIVEARAAELGGAVPMMMAALEGKVLSLM